MGDDSDGVVEVDPPTAAVDVLLEEVVANFVKRSEMLFNWIKLGRRIFTSGSRQRGWWSPSTADSWSTLMGISWVITVSRSRGPVPDGLAVAVALSMVDEEWSVVVVASGMSRALDVVVQEVARIVSARRGTLPFLVSLRLASLADTAERRARWSAPMGTSRLIAPVLDSQM